MKTSQHVKDNHINSFVDGELDGDESVVLLEQLEHDSKLQRELCDTHRIKDMMKMAYPETNNNNDQINDSNRNLLGSIAACFVFLIVGFLSGSFYNPSNTFNLSQVTAQEQKLVLFIGYSDDKKFEETLNQAESFLKTHRGKQVKVNVVASAGGIDLLRNGHSSFIPRIHELSKSYDALDFIACNNTIDKLKNEGKTVSIINEALVAPSAVEFVVKRLQQGWSYLAI